jgi:E1A/CREB-binding protein
VIPDSFPVRSKCIALFQKIHGVDTLLFALYVYEYGHECPAPNRRRVYISYLDSVQYFYPKCYRTLVYQSILVEYLRYVKNRGFHTAHIWSCPPTPGDDYIFYCHPSHQLVPHEDMLRTWYHKMLSKAKAQGIVIRTTTLFDEYFASETGTQLSSNVDITSIPYFEGDYVPGEIENIVRRLASERGDIVYNPSQTASDDEVANRLGQNLRKMKDNFIVVHLRNRRFAAAVELGQDVSSWTEDSDEELIRSKRAKISGKTPDFTSSSIDDTSSEVVGVTEEKGHNDHSDGAVVEDPEQKQIAESSSDACGLDTTVHEPKLDVDKNSDLHESLESMVAKHAPSVKTRSRQFVSNTLDEDDPIESEMFESRQQFLNYCQSNHCQFDQLRRAKHSTMLVLFQLHNPGAPKFLRQCGACYRDITHGILHHCNQCSNFDLCQDCYLPVTSGEWALRDKRFAHDESHLFTAEDMESKACEVLPPRFASISPMSDANREIKHQQVRDCLEVLDHVARCNGPEECTLSNCQRLKALIRHVGVCPTKPKRDCKICTRLLSLCTIHARMCGIARTGNCPIPYCDRIRDRNDRLRRQQKLMDDRRRQAQNELYHAGAETTATNSGSGA